jgi:hypothetical protein
MSEPRRADRFAYLNNDPAWAGFDLTRLERLPGGALGLTRAPRPVGDIGLVPAPAVPPAFDGPAGVVEAGGDLYASDPAAHRVSRLNACLARPEPLPCVGGPGPWPGQLHTPRGLAALPGAAGFRLAVAEEGNNRVQVFDAATGQSLLVVGKTGPDGRPEPGDGPGEFRAPWGLAADARGCLYVADHGNGRVQKLGPRGDPDAGFADTLAAQPSAPKSPVALTVAGPAGGQRLLVLDVSTEGTGRVVWFDTRGNALCHAPRVRRARGPRAGRAGGRRR